MSGEEEGRFHPLLEALWKIQQCFACGGYGACRHREIEMDMAYLEALDARANRLRKPVTMEKRQSPASLGIGRVK